MKSITFLLPKAPMATKFQWKLSSNGYKSSNSNNSSNGNKKLHLRFWLIFDVIWACLNECFSKLFSQNRQPSFIYSQSISHICTCTQDSKGKKFQFCFSILFLRVDFYIFMGKTNQKITISLKCSICTKKLINKKVRKCLFWPATILFFWSQWAKTQIFKSKHIRW